jgi:DNA-binding XRE family transcriptional regulator
MIAICSYFIIFASKVKNIAMAEDLNRIKIVLCEKKRTSKWLADQLNVNPTTVSKWCTNTTQPDLYTLKKIADLVEVNIQDLLKAE